MDTFECEKTRDAHVEPENIYFVEGEQEILARHLGKVFWLPPERAYTVFLYAYSVLFGIPVFTGEAVRRQPNQFSRKQLPHTVRTTTGFILDGFGYDRRRGRPREVVYSLSPAIRGAHRQSGSKQRISNPAMAYFAYHLILAMGRLSPRRDAPDFDLWRSQHYDYFGGFFRSAGYPLPYNRAEAEAEAEALCIEVDKLLAGNTFAECWRNILYTAEVMNLKVARKALIEFLSPKSSRLFAKATESVAVLWY